MGKGKEEKKKNKDKGDKKKGKKGKGKNKWEKKQRKDAAKWADRKKFGAVAGFDFPYALSSGKPDHFWRLPAGTGDLDDCSGIVYDARLSIQRSKRTFHLIEDKEPLMSTWEPSTNMLINQERVNGAIDDLEDLCVANDQFYVCASDGTVFTRARDGEWEVFVRLEPNLDLEGIAVRDDELIILSKADARLFFYSIPRRVLLRTKIIAKAEISRVLDEEIDTFNPSAVAVHPETGDLYVTATRGQLLVVLDGGEAMSIKACVHLPRDPFVQPEGITFDDEANLYIANEGRGKEGGPGWGTVVMFKYMRSE